jgi:hypothetical protein
VHSDATPAQSALAPECSSACEGSGHAGNIEVLGWCVYWCVDGFQEEVLGIECVPRWAYVPITTVVGGRTETVTSRFRVDGKEGIGVLIIVFSSNESGGVYDDDF